MSHWICWKRISEDLQFTIPQDRTNQERRYGVQYQASRDSEISTGEEDPWRIDKYNRSIGLYREEEWDSNIDCLGEENKDSRGGCFSNREWNSITKQSHYQNSEWITREIRHQFRRNGRRDKEIMTTTKLTKGNRWIITTHRR